MLEQHLVPLSGATLEVFIGGAGRPVVCTTHALTAYTAEGNALSKALLGICRAGG